MRTPHHGISLGFIRDRLTSSRAATPRRRRSTPRGTFESLESRILLDHSSTSLTSLLSALPAEIRPAVALDVTEVLAEETHTIAVPPHTSCLTTDPVSLDAPFVGPAPAPAGSSVAPIVGPMPSPDSASVVDATAAALTDNLTGAETGSPAQLSFAEMRAARTLVDLTHHAYIARFSQTQAAPASGAVPSTPSLHSPAPQVFQVQATSQASQIEIDTATTYGPAPKEVDFYDGQGSRIVGVVPQGDHPHISVNVSTFGPGGSMFYMKITPNFDTSPTFNGGTPALTITVGYLIQMVRQYSPRVVFATSSLFSRGIGQELLQNVLPDRLGTASVAPGDMRPFESESDSIAQGTEGTGPLGPTTIASGPLPGRGAAPLGGVLSIGDPTPEVDRFASAHIDFDLLAQEQSPRDRDDDGGESGRPTARTAELPSPRDSLSVARGSGGFPLLVSSFRAAPASRETATIAVFPIESGIGTLADQIEPPLPASELSGRGRDGVEDRPRPRLKTSALAGMTLAFALVFGLALPDLVSTFTDGRSPRWPIRSRLRRALGDDE